MKCLVRVGLIVYLAYLLGTLAACGQKGPLVLPDAPKRKHTIPTLLTPAKPNDTGSGTPAPVDSNPATGPAPPAAPQANPPQPSATPAPTSPPQS